MWGLHVRHALPASDIIAPNLLELEILCEHPVNTVEEAVSASRELIAQGPEVVLVKHLARAGLNLDRFEMLLVTKPGISAARWWILVFVSPWGWEM